MPKGSKRKRPVVPTQPRKEASRPEGPPPWAPTAIFAWTLLAGPLFGAIFAVANIPRLRLRQLLLPTLLMAAVAQFTPDVAIHWLRVVKPTAPAALGLAFLMRAVAAYYFSATQREAYWDHLDAGGRSANLTIPTLLALILFPFQFVWMLGQ